MSALPWRLLVPAVAIEAGLSALLASQHEFSRVPDAIAILLGTFAVYIISVWVVLKKPQSSPRLILAAAVIFRLTIWPLYPTFTDDLFRYRWEARLQLSGSNPYAKPPSDPSVAFLRDETFTTIPGRDFRAVYGPATEHVYRIAFSAIQSLTPNPYQQIFWLKFPAAIFDLGILAILWHLLPAEALPRSRILLYAWSPLPIFEFWGNGHNDALALCPLVAALYMARRHHWTWAFSMLGLAAAAKVWPAALAPLFWRPSRWRQSLMFPVIGILLMLPFGSGLISNVRFLSGFLGGWRNNDSIYGLLLWITGDQYPAKYAAFAIAFLAVAFALLRHLPLIKGSLVVIATMLLVSANCHPWYLTWLLPLLAFHPSLALLAWTGLIPIAYQVLPRWELLGEWNGSTSLRWYIYLPVFALLAWESWKFLKNRDGSRPQIPRS